MATENPQRDRRLPSWEMTWEFGPGDFIHDGSRIVPGGNLTREELASVRDHLNERLRCQCEPIYLLCLVDYEDFEPTSWSTDISELQAHAQKRDRRLHLKWRPDSQIVISRAKAAGSYHWEIWVVGRSVCGNGDEADQ